MLVGKTPKKAYSLFLSAYYEPIGLVVASFQEWMLEQGSFQYNNDRTLFQYSPRAACWWWLYPVMSNVPVNVQKWTSGLHTTTVLFPQWSTINSLHGECWNHHSIPQNTLISHPHSHNIISTSMNIPRACMCMQYIPLRLGRSHPTNLTLAS